ncbi:DNA glycosylase [Pisolithus croceorrhizus]|nr:DNA glycosylase [Pisolithus croceorrhizus]
MKSPYPLFIRPTAEETRVVYALLAAHTPGGVPILHSEPKDASDAGNSTSAPRTGSSALPNVLDSVIGTILSQNTSSQNYTRAKSCLDATFGTGEAAFGRMANAEVGEVARAIKCGGLANKKANTIQTLLKSVKAKHGKYNLQHLHTEEIPNCDAMRELVSYKGVGPKTAACVLSFCLGRQAFAVDTHVFRLARMLGWVPEDANPVEAQAHLELRIPSELKYGLHVMLVKHGRTCRGCRYEGKGSCPLKAWLLERNM